eukprot:SAG31_NODE_5106_length_2740_cov_6.966538_2_plen_296_part_00
MSLTKVETAHLFVAKRQASASRVLQAIIRTSKERNSFLKTRSEGTVAAQTVQRLYRLISGETGVRFQSIVNQMEKTRHGFFSRMDILVEKYKDVPPRTHKFGGGHGGFEMWVKIRVIKPGVDLDGKGVDTHADFGANKQLYDETFAGHSSKLKKAPGIIGDFFSESGNAHLTDHDGNYVWHRDPTYFSYIMDYIRDGDVSWPADAHQLESLLEECDYFEVGPMVLLLIEQLKKAKFNAGVSVGTGGITVTPAAAAPAVAPAPASKADGPCDNFRIDLTASEFGMCKCGWKKADHK